MKTRALSAVFFFITFCSSSAKAEWVYLQDIPMSDLKAETFMESNNHSSYGKYRTVDILTNYDRPTTMWFGFGVTYRSQINTYEFDCSVQKMRTLKKIQYSGPMATGTIVSEEKQPTSWSGATGSFFGLSFVTKSYYLGVCR